MDAPPILQRHPALRWLAPVGVAGVAGIVATGFFGSSSNSTASLPATTPAALIAAVQQPRVTGFSGTVVSHLSLGLPELPTVAGADDATSFTSLLSGSHTMQVWYGAADRQRVALLGSTDETDVFRDGREMWEWSSSGRSAAHVVLPSRSGGSGPLARLSAASLTPLGLAQHLLTGLEPSTRIAVDRTREVADRSAYDLVLTPKTTDTKVGQVRITVDGRTKVPLGVQVLARGATSPSVDVAFTKIAFGRQAERTFRFTPPSGAKVRNVQLRPRAEAQAPAAGRSPQAVRSGSGWGSVLELRTTPERLKSLLRNEIRPASTPVSGSWGKGYLLDSDLISALITSDGRVLIGAVPPSALYAAAGSK